jgi:hypothetical protein
VKERLWMSWDLEHEEAPPGVILDGWSVRAILDRTDSLPLLAIVERHGLLYRVRLESPEHVPALMKAGHRWARMLFEQKSDRQS